VDKRNRSVEVLLSLAALWSAGLVAVPFFLSANGAIEDSPTLVQQNGIKYLFLAGIPFLIVAAVGLSLGWYRTSRSRPPLVVTWVLSGLMVGVALVGILTVGPLVFPVAGLLLAAVSLAVIEREHRHN
jgi:CHASE2 domain-containing sensor protein